LQSPFLPQNIRLRYPDGATTRTFHVSSLSSQEAGRREDAKDSPRPSTEPGNATKGNEGSRESAKSASDSQKSENGQEGEGESKQEQKKTEDAPPPPPHGDKTPWQVFTDTLRSEFKASKEWNESTKALASSAHQFTENESVKRARAAYTAASGAASSTTASALNKTGRAIGKTAAWTWDTTVVKGVRAGVNATGRVIERGTRPVRETEAYKKAVGGVKDVIDDGSSSRYGGWIEKEERRKARELRELNEARTGGGLGKPVEKMEEDPK
jgi:import inner membrane translocase subunit TIM44